MKELVGGHSKSAKRDRYKDVVVVVDSSRTTQKGTSFRYYFLSFLVPVFFDEEILIEFRVFLFG